MGQILNDITFQVNNSVLPLVNNTCVVDDGDPEYIISTALSGNNVDLNYSINYETAMASIKCSCYSTIVNIELIKEWKQLPQGLVVKLFSRSSDYSRVMTLGTLINKIEYNLQAEGTIELEFVGNKLV